MTEDTPIQFPQDDRQLLQQMVVLMQDMNHRFRILEDKVESRLYDTRPIWEQVKAGQESTERKVDLLVERVESIERKVDLLAERVDSMERKIDLLVERVESIERRLDIIDSRLNRIEIELEDLNRSLRQMQLDNLRDRARFDERLSKLESPPT